MTAIDAALAQGLDTKVVVIGHDVLPRAGATFAELFPGERAILVADDNTWRVAGLAVARSLIQAGVGCAEPIVYPGKPTLFANDHQVDDLTGQLARDDAIAVSIASGSLNDVTKLASARLGRSYLNVCTAASVDGYTSFGAAIVVDGVKGTQPCPAPRGVIVPLDVMAAAPVRLTATGFGDLIEKVPAGADWIVADELGIEPIDQPAWDLVQSPLRAALADPVGLVGGDQAAIAALANGLILSGLAMQSLGSSRPASGAGHYFSHQWEMEGYGLAWDPPLSHGFKVGLGTLAMAALYEEVLKLDLAHLDIPARLAAWPTPAQDAARVRALQPNPVIQRGAVEQSAAKYLAPAQAAVRLRQIADRWQSIRARATAQLWPAAVIEQRLRQVGAIHHPAQIGVSLGQLRLKYYQAQTIRTRYTVLDLLQEAGALNDLVERLFRPGGYWYERGETA